MAHTAAQYCWGTESARSIRQHRAADVVAAAPQPAPQPAEEAFPVSQPVWEVC